jgi:hypothetical protein
MPGMSGMFSGILWHRLHGRSAIRVWTDYRNKVAATWLRPPIQNGTDTCEGRYLRVSLGLVISRNE